MKYRMTAVLLSLVGALISTYLFLFKLGLVGRLVCGTGECEQVQFSKYSHIAGVDVSLLGLLGYGAIFLISLASLQPRWAGERWPVRLMTLFAAGGVALSAWLTGVEIFILHAICRWCVGSATIITLTFIVSLLAWRAAPPQAARPSGA